MKLIKQLFPNHDTPTALAIITLFLFAVIVAIYTVSDTIKHGYVEDGNVYCGLFFGLLSAAIYVFGKAKSA
ncbi:hypothetical protein MUN82_01970 [Hymenobacter aerilatus]|uniref:Uncharacterized protein n=1 Tax=Hymenobacter aerilatus TaxID=2932251 RepID=A0A8T9SUV8_9BACT|nr:hypothetical protein [Hymenobacter aerilatus]UOR05878.1 hypothetical protein MUN82_01970 [Hymenobacter aerilatus]